VSFGVASVPGGGLVAALTLLRILGLPAEGIGLVLATDRILDMFRTTVNVCSYTTCSVLVAKSDGETVLAKKEALLP
jgi:Na+/H+-dicarboxylate symporter